MYFVKYKILFFCILIGLITFSLSCKRFNGNLKKDAIDTLLTKSISFSDKLLVLNGKEFQSVDSFNNETEGKTKIISIVDGNCMKCVINQLNYIDSLFYSILNDSDNILIFILNVNNRDSVYFMRNLQPAIKAKGTILWDNNYNFERENMLFTPELNLRTFMINSENKIIYYGSPVIDSNIIYEYQEKLELY